MIKMKFKSIFIFIFIVCCSFGIQTSDKPVSIAFPEKNCAVKIDGFGNIYVINAMQIIKYNTLGVLQKSFSVKRYGKIDFVDVSNPLKLLVYYKDFQQVLFLDDQLTATSSMISLENIGYEQTSLICNSSNNSFWLYDKQNNSLLRFNSESKTLVKTGNLKRILDIDMNPNFMIEHNGYLYLNCPKEGIMLFDIYGTFYKTIPIKDLKEFNVINENVFYFKDKALNEYKASTFNTIQKQFADTLIKNVYWQNDKFYTVYADSVRTQ